MDGRSGQHPPHLGATFYPGGADDFYVPELISPAPKRLIPEVPDHIQENLAHLELDGTHSQANRLSGLQSPSPMVEMPGSVGRPSRNSSVSTLSTITGYTQSSGPLNNQPNQAVRSDVLPDQPTFSPFPRLQPRTSNVPPSDDEKEAILESARNPVLNSTDPEIQLTWAQDTLSFVEIAAQDAARAPERHGTRPATPRIEHQLRLDAVNVVSFLADQSHPRAEFMRGMWLEFGKFGFRMDKKEAYRCYSRAAQNGHARAHYRMGMQFETSNDPSNAIKHYTLGMEAGDSASDYRLGMMALLGQHGQQLDYARGVKLIKRSADTADENAPQGAYVLGMLQARELKQISVPDQVLPPDIGGARYHIEKAAYLGFAKAQTKMGAAYELCQLGCDFDPALSLHYNALASRQGEPDADMAISKWFLCGQKGLFEKSDELAFKYAERAAQSGLPTAEFAMGYFFEIGIHVRPDLNEAKTWYHKAADHGYAEAAGRIEGISRSKTLSKKDHQDIAIARIRSMHGSKRGPRPDRSRNHEHMPTLSDRIMEVPDGPPSKPYPVDGRPYASTVIGSTQRPMSAAPYPEDTSFGARSGFRPAAYSNRSDLIKPDMRPASAASVASSPSNSAYRTPMIPPLGPPRSSSQDSSASGRGRGQLPYGSAPVAPGYRQPYPSLNHVQSMGTPPNMLPSRSSNIDVGFSAPPDPSGADRRGKLQKGTNRPSDGPGSASKPPPAPTTAADRNAQRISSRPDTQAFTRQSRTSSPGRQSNSRPGSSQGYTPFTGAAMKPSTDHIPPLLPPKIPASGQPSTPPPSSTTKPPGKGPKTFEEMGVPAQKQKDECVSRHTKLF
ncbi:MAG: hypothetical protein LQ350_004585 [Teloschistes chrysophthalmus]|nr:MAG: hypothetical protein LQ350_004585 [Niorma chrysophthalma]